MKTTGIYMITNNVNGKVYIGQSVFIERRIPEHLRAGQPELYAGKNQRDSTTPVHRAMQKYGVSSFSFTILETCPRELLNERERYWINHYRSNDNQYGYNLTQGGQENFGLSGEKHGQAKLTQVEVDEIKRLLKTTRLTLTEINKQFPQVSKSTLSMINHGKAWYHPNETYPLRIMEVGSKGGKNPRAKLSDEIVMDMRRTYADGAKWYDACKKYQGLASQASLENAIFGRTYKHLPIWDNIEKKWT